MKKALFLLLVCGLLWSALTVSAGSVPEDLLLDGAQIFFAEVVDCRTVDGKMQVTLIPVKTVKGDVKLSAEQTYSEVSPVGRFLLLKGKAYLFAYFDENNPTYVFRVSGYDPRTLSLIVPEEVRRNMFGRFEEYLNDGSYTAAEAQRRQRLGLLDGALQVEGDLPPLDRGGGIPRMLVIAGGGVALLAVGAAVCGYIRARRKVAS